MKKPITLFLIINFFAILLTVLYSFAAEERITLTTYYPAPYGIYKEMRVDQIAVGSLYRYSPDLTNGTLIVSELVGIGTSSPQRQLHIAGDGFGGMGSDSGLLITAGANADTTYLLINPGNATSPYVDIFAWDNSPSGPRNLTLNRQGGNVGIGTSTPYSRLHINSAPPTDANSGQLRITESTTANTLLLGRTQNYGFIQSHNSEPLLLNPLGNNIGIGTTNPSGTLHVYGGTAGAGAGRDIILQAENATQMGFEGGDIILMPGDSNPINYHGGVAIGTDNPYTNSMLTVRGKRDTMSHVTFVPGEDTAAAGTPSLRVGIGTAMPGSHLDIHTHDEGAWIQVGSNFGDSYAHAGIALVASEFDPSFTKSWSILHSPGIGAAPYQLRFNYGTSGYTNTYMALKTTGEVGIGTTNPQGKLHVVGNLRVDNNVGDSCHWLPSSTDWYDITTTYGTRETTCDAGEFMAGVAFKNGGENDELDMWRLYCCKL